MLLLQDRSCSAPLPSAHDAANVLSRNTLITRTEMTADL